MQNFFKAKQKNSVANLCVSAPLRALLPFGFVFAKKLVTLDLLSAGKDTQCH